jgi:hypothetical protein
VYKIGEELEDVATGSFVPFGSFLSESQAVRAHTDAASYRFVRSKCVGYASGQNRVILPLLSVCTTFSLRWIYVSVAASGTHNDHEGNNNRSPALFLSLLSRSAVPCLAGIPWSPVTLVEEVVC